jgi:hypothetical protein
VLQRIDNNSNVPRPRDQITGMRIFHALEIFVPRINLEGTRVWILVSRRRVNLMNGVRAIPHAGLLRFLLPRYFDDRAPFLGCQQSYARLGLFNGYRYLRRHGRNPNQANTHHSQARHFQNDHQTAPRTPFKSRPHLAHSRLISSTFREKDPLFPENIGDWGGQ